MRILGITGTDTGVGKTRVGAAIVCALSRAGLSVAALKPVASGVPRGEDSDDAVELGRAAGHEPRVFASFEAAVSPHRAAAFAGVSVSRDALAAWIGSFEEDVIVVEGAGGWRTPLGADADGWYFLDDLPIDAVVAVAPNRLGVLSQTNLLLGAIPSRIRFQALFLNDGVGDPADPSRGTNEADLRYLMSSVVPQTAPLIRVREGGVDEIAALLVDFAQDWAVQRR